MKLKTITNVESNYGTKLNIIKTEETESPLPGIIPFDPEIQYWFSVRNLKSVLSVKYFTPMYAYIGYKRKDARTFFPFIDYSNYIILNDLIHILENDKFIFYVEGKLWLLNEVIPNLSNLNYITGNEYYQKRIHNEWPN